VAHRILIRLAISPLSISDPRKSDLHYDQEVLMDVVHQVFKVGVHWSLCVNCRLFVSEQVVELDNADSDYFLFLCAQNALL